MENNRTQHFDSQSFRDAIANSSGPVLVDFYADWCPPCRALAATIDALAAELGDRAIIGKLDVDAHRDIAGEFGIRSIPTILIFANGEIVQRFTGVVAKDALARALDDATSRLAA